MINIVRIKYDGRYTELSAEQLDMDRESPTDHEVLQAVEQHLEMESGHLSEFVLDPPQSHQDRPAATILNIFPDPTYGLK